MKKLISILLAMTLIVSCFTVPVLAENEAITLELVLGANDASWSATTIPGTIINTLSAAELAEGQEIAYFLNDEEVGRELEAGTFNFESVAGANKFQAKIMDGETVVASSNVVELDFVRLTKGETLKSSPLSNEDELKATITNAATSLDAGWARFDADPADEDAGTVLHMKEPSAGAAAVGLSLDGFVENDPKLDTGMVRVDFEFYAVSFAGTMYSAYIETNCGCNHTQQAFTDWPSQKASNVTREYTYPERQWIDMSLVVDNENKTYDLYAEGVQMITQRPFCINAAHNNQRITSIQFPRPGWAGTVKLTDEEGNPLYELDDEGNPKLNDKGNPIQLTEKHNAEFYLKNVEYYKVEAARITASVPSTALVGGEFMVVASEKFDPDMQYVYVVDGVESEPTDSNTYVCQDVKKGETTVVVKAVIDGEVIMSTEEFVVEGKSVILSSTHSFPYNALNIDLKVDDNANTSYEKNLAASENHETRYQVAEGVFEDREGAIEFYLKDAAYNQASYPQAASRYFFTNKEAQYVSVSYDINISKLANYLNIQIDNYYQGGEGYPSVFVFNSDGTLGVGVEKYGKITTTYNKDQWYNVEMIISNPDEVVFFLVDGVVVSTVAIDKFNSGKALVLEDILSSKNLAMFMIAGLGGKAGADKESLVYFDNYEIKLGLAPTVEVATVANGKGVPVGSKVMVTANANVEDVTYNYYLNGELYDANSDDAVSYAQAEKGTNTVYAEILDKTGDVIATSEPVVFEGYKDEFVAAVERSGSLSTLNKHNKHNPASAEYKDFGAVDAVNDAETFADGAHGEVLKLSAAQAGEQGNGINVLTAYANRRPKTLMEKATKLYAQSVDVYPESIIAGALTFRFYNPSLTSTERSFAWFKIDTDYIYIAKNVGATEFEKIPYTGDWYTLKAIYNPAESTYTLAVNDIIYAVIVEEVNAPAVFANENIDQNCLYLDITLNGSLVEGNPNVVYIDNHVLSYSTVPFVEVSTLAENKGILAGSKIMVNATSNVSDAKYNFYINGKLFEEANTSGEAYAKANAGVNIVYAEIIDADGEVVAVSEDVTFEGFIDEFVNVAERSGSTSTFQTHNKHVPTSTEYKDYGAVSSENDVETFAGTKHGDVLKLSAAQAGEQGNGINVLTAYANRKPNALMANADKMYAQSVDVYPESIVANNVSFRFYAPSLTNAERHLSGFKIDSDYIYVAKDLGATDFVKVPYTSDWYTLKIIYDPANCNYSLLVDDVVYSIIVDEANAPAVFNDPEKLAGNYLYLDVLLGGSLVEGNPNVVYIDNHVLSYSAYPEVHSEIKYLNKADYITNKSEISSASDLIVEFVAVKGDYENVLCVATIVDAKGKLQCVATQTVDFTEEIEAEAVTLTLENLPEDLATGDYSVNVMLWDAETFKPITAKTVMAD